MSVEVSSIVLGQSFRSISVRDSWCGWEILFLKRFVNAVVDASRGLLRLLPTGGPGTQCREP